jgi:cell wall-associated NlpC family hydrolase
MRDSLARQGMDSMDPRIRQLYLDDKMGAEERQKKVYDLATKEQAAAALNNFWGTGGSGYAAGAGGAGGIWDDFGGDGIAQDLSPENPDEEEDDDEDDQGERRDDTERDESDNSGDDQPEEDPETEPNPEEKTSQNQENPEQQQEAESEPAMGEDASASKAANPATKSAPAGEAAPAAEATSAAPKLAAGLGEAETAATAPAALASAGSTAGSVAGLAGSTGGAVAAGEAGFAVAELGPWILLIFGVVAILLFLLTAMNIKYPAKACADTVAASSSGNVIVLDPGHPSEVGSGAESKDGSVKEVEKVFEIAKLIKPKLEKLGYTVVMTRSNNSTVVTNKERADLANSKNAAFMFRIHDDSRGNNRGFALYYPSKQGTVNGTSGPSASVIASSKSGTQAIFNAAKDSFTSTGMPVYNGGILTDNETAEGQKHGGALAGSIYSKVPVSLIEIGSLDNSDDIAWLKNSGNLDKIADGLANGIAAAAPLKAATTTAADTSTKGKFFFPVLGTQKSYSGSTKASGQPRGPSNGSMVRGSADSSFFQWTIPDNKGSKSDSNQPGYGACRGNGCERLHKGDDIYASFGAPVVSPEDGNIVAYGGSAVKDATEAAGGGKGRWLKIKGASGETYTFMHLEGYSDEVLKGLGLSNQISNTSEKSANFAVKGGDIIAYVGNTGGIQNPHLHFEISDGGKDPKPTLESWLSGKATTTANAGGTDSQGCPVDSSTGNSLADAAIALARKQIGKPYVWAAAGPDSFDCSGLVLWVYAQVSGGKINLPHYTVDQYASPLVQKIKSGEELPGDLVFFSKNGTIHHVGIVIGNGRMIEAPYTGANVRESSYTTRSDTKLFARVIVK